MRRLAAEHADGVLLNWLTPEAAAGRREEMRTIRAEAGVSAPFMTAAFVRVAIGDAAIARLRHEAEKYESFPAYGKHFAEMGVGAFETAVAATSVEEAADGLLPFIGALDHAVLRCVVGSDDDPSYLTLVEAGRLAIERSRAT
jgi:alkanesulfonate monooxygenase SsuD/methylene tetrahydromethanopterin reductase-like flavin-dependent oxidoreductase (luciferase family)